MPAHRVPPGARLLGSGHTGKRRPPRVLALPWPRGRPACSNRTPDLRITGATHNPLRPSPRYSGPSSKRRPVEETRQGMTSGLDIFAVTILIPLERGRV